MIKDAENLANAKMNLYLKDGRTFKYRDIPSAPFGENEHMVSFWETEDKISVFPLNLVEKIELVLKEK